VKAPAPQTGSYFAFHNAHAAPQVAASRRVFQADGLASNSGPITRSQGARAVIPQSFRPLTLVEESNLMARGEEIVSAVPQVSNARASDFDTHEGASDHTVFFFKGNQAQYVELCAQAFMHSTLQLQRSASERLRGTVHA
jgi:hypothetical protein